MEDANDLARSSGRACPQACAGETLRQKNGFATWQRNALAASILLGEQGGSGVEGDEDLQLAFGIERLVCFGIERKAVYGEVGRGDQAREAFHGHGVDQPRSGFSARNVDACLDMQLARAAVVPEPVGGVAVLLRFEHDHAGSDGVYGACVDEDHVACLDGDHAELCFNGTVGDGGFDLGVGERLAKANRDGGAGFGRKHVPALGFAPRHAQGLGLLVIGMNLHGELFAREKEF